MYENLLMKIDSQEEANKEQIVNYLKDAANAIASLDENKIDSISLENSVFQDAYKDIAQKSLSSYEDTTTEINKLSQMQKNTLEKYNSAQIDLPSITEKFAEIQQYMANEVSKANAIITELTVQVKDLEEKSNLDPLTKVFNRRALTTYLHEVCSRQGVAQEFHLLIIDLDDFKRINDEHGHQAGDKVLIFIANILRKTLRDGDRVFRYGGEEFIITLNRVDENHCFEVVERLLNVVRSNKLIYKGENLKVTMSIGATKLFSSDTPDTLVARADKALYKAKENGKNQMYADMNNGI
jgi:diguanylate cyclase